MNVKFSTKFVAASAAAVMALSLAGCSGGSMDDSSSSGAKASGDSITIGTVTTNSGTAAAYGEAEVKGFELAVSEINAKGGINGKKVKLESMDDKGDATEASNAYNKLAGDNNVLAVAGPTISATTAAVAPLADQSKLVTIAPAATSDSIETGNYLFRTCFKDSYQGEVAARFAAENLKVKKVAVLYGTGDPYSSGVGEAFAKAAEKLGLEVVDKESSSSADDTEYSAQLQKIQASGAELLYAPYYYSVAGPYIIPQARSVGFEGYVMGPDGYDGLKLTGDKSQYNKTYYTTHYSADDNTNTKVQDFIKSYKSKNNAEPNTFAALGYDTIYMIKQAIEKAGKNATREDVRNAVASMTFDGVTGKFTMDKSGSPTKSVIVLEMKDGKPVYNTTVQPK
ncbi:ABC transporter substrate-binding protein [Bifidobacterium longum]|uniref:ABC transporter substrate-binding protein n=4 Tax=Bifidobacterium longum TaxID=216816 RepID=A0A269T9V7_BIFLN|nr:ABC transporter substrate-binding protein [Bifidobacterium longum]AEI96928.1 branched-chain amino acid ABC transporter substrate-binding protein [Bifidobacterium longum subsp. longum KACC 91563]KXS29281.1 MAG: branched-chain amino acid ABC transporter substrate-binding protein [Bifidobacterium longum]MBD3900373.1 ABC transporter substrate-binding protein [Bifidobacterium longum subsp. longum]MBU9068054.1 ABC transporter substrate-binding protein [Bifidobacterium longum]MBV3120649.1 ABC tran